MYNKRYNDADFAYNFVSLRKRYNAPAFSYLALSPVFPWSLEEYLAGRNHWNYKGHSTLLKCGNDLAHAVLARDEWGIIWC